MKPINAKPAVLKRANLSLLRKALRQRGTATRAQLTQDTGISSTTVRSLLGEMEQDGEVLVTGLDASSGGRKAQRYALRPDGGHCAVFCTAAGELDALLVNACGEIVSTHHHAVPDGALERVITGCLDALTVHTPLKAIGLGVCGAVEDGGFWHVGSHETLLKTDIGDAIAARYGVPVVLENDVNATALGFGHCYAQKYPLENPTGINMAYIQIDPDCISAGFLAGGSIVRGARNFAGELSLLPFEGEKTLVECLTTAADDAAYCRIVTHALCWVCGILNPQYVTLGGAALRKIYLGPIADGLYALLPRHMVPELLTCADARGDYHAGMALLTAARMYDAVQLVCE